MEKTFSPFPTRNYQINLSPAGKLSIIYLIISLLWILLGDNLAFQIAGNDVKFLEKIHVAKGFFFVFASTALIYTLSKKFQSTLQQSHTLKEGLELKFQALNEACLEGVLEYDPSQDTSLINDKMRQFLGVNENRIGECVKFFTARIHPDDLEKVHSEFEKLKTGDRKIWSLEFRLKGPDGKYAQVLSSICIIRDLFSGKAKRLIATIMDISELRDLQGEYYEQQLRYKHVLAKSIIKAQEMERNRWAEELHDNACQLLTVVHMYLSEINSGRFQSSEILPEVQKMVKEALDEIRRLSAMLKPPEFSNNTLEDSIRQLASNLKRFREYNFEIDFSLAPDLQLVEDQQLMIYRVIQEQLTNIAKYAEPTKVKVEVMSCGNRVNIVVEDNGRGFDSRKAQQGIGLKNIQGRLQVFKGQMAIQSAPGKGCRLAASFPI